MILSTDGQLPLAERIANLREYMKRTSSDISLWGGCNASELLDALAASEAGAAVLTAQLFEVATEAACYLMAQTDDNEIALRAEVEASKKTIKMDEKPPLLARMEAMEAAIRERVKAGHNDTCGAVISSPKATYPCTCGHDALAALEGK